ncbi:MAG: NUDIX domain-containing protein, partial [Candidatus Promineifilaceae bacterium]
MKQLESELLYKGRWSLYLDTIELASGKAKQVPRIDHPGSVVMIPMIGNQVVMLKQYRHAVGDTILELPAGTLERGEQPLPSAQRELREET